MSEATKDTFYGGQPKAMTTQDTEFEKWCELITQQGIYHTSEAAFRAGRMVQREIDAEIADKHYRKKEDAVSDLDVCYREGALDMSDLIEQAIREQEIP